VDLAHRLSSDFSIQYKTATSEKAMLSKEENSAQENRREADRLMPLLSAENRAFASLCRITFLRNGQKSEINSQIPDLILT